MSCTVIAVPIALSWVAQTILTGTLVTGGVIGLVADRIQHRNEEDFFVINNEHENGCENENSHSITMSHFIEKEFDTPFADQEILKKTLEEHGVVNIECSETSVVGKVENYTLKFMRQENNENYKLRISCLEDENAEEKVNDIATEYSMNVQEDTYLHILKKLKENNMQIEEETVEEDNTIVLTVNID